MGIRHIAFAAVLLACCGVPANATHAVVLYEFIEASTGPNPGGVGATLLFDAPPASATSGWSTSTNFDILNFNITDPAIAPVGFYSSSIQTAIVSNNGMSLDSGEIVGTMGSVMVDTVLDGNFSSLQEIISGDAMGAWVLGVQSVPEPSSFVLAGIAAVAAVGAWARRRNRNI